MLRPSIVTAPIMVFLLICTVTAQEVYWTNATSIGRASLDGSWSEDIVVNILRAPPDAVAIDSSAGKMYWTERYRPKICRANIDGSHVEELVTSGLSGPWSIAIDIAGGKMYWTDFTGHEIQRSNLDGSDVEVLVTDTALRPSGIALDPAAGKMYWMDFDGGKIQRANLDGSGVEDVVVSGLLRPRALAIDVSAGQLYWVDYTTIGRVNIDGSGLVPLLTDLTSALGLSLDLQSGKMYWTDTTSSGSARRWVRRANLDGSSIENLVTEDPTYPHAIYPYGLALDLDARQLYWTDWRATEIRRASFDGSDVATILSRRIITPFGIAIDLPSGKVYWTDLQARAPAIQRANLDGSDVEEISIEPHISRANAIAIDQSERSMYWADLGTGAICRAGLDGSDSKVIVAGAFHMSEGIALDLVGQRIYWTNTSVVQNLPKSIRCATLDGSDVQDIVPAGLEWPSGIAVDPVGRKVYWTDRLAVKIQRANLDGSGVEDIVWSGIMDPVGIALDIPAGKLYWSDVKTQKIQRANLDGTDVEDVTATWSSPYGIALNIGCGAEDCQPNGIGDACETDSDDDGVIDDCDQCPGEDDHFDGNQDGIPDCLEPDPIPAVSGWGLFVMMLSLLCVMKIKLGCRPVASASGSLPLAP